MWEYYGTQQIDLYHSGVKGMKKGVRRYQNADGSLTALGRIRYGVNAAGRGIERGAVAVGKGVGRGTIAVGKAVGSGVSKAGKSLGSSISEKRENKRVQKLMKKKVSKLTPKELKERTEREKQIYELEKYRNDTKDMRSKEMSGFMKTAVDKVVKPAVIEAGKSVLEDGLTRFGKAKIGDYLEKPRTELQKVKYDLALTTDKWKTVQNRAKLGQLTKQELKDIKEGKMANPLNESNSGKESGDKNKSDKGSGGKNKSDKGSKESQMYGNRSVVFNIGSQNRFASNKTDNSNRSRFYDNSQTRTTNTANTTNTFNRNQSVNVGRERYEQYSNYESPYREYPMRPALTTNRRRLTATRRRLLK